MPKYADRMKYMEKTADIVSGLFNSMLDAETISFSGGAPAKEALPVDELRQIANDVLRTDGKGVTALQYGKPEGWHEFREVIVQKLLAAKGINATVDNVIITSGGIEPMNLLCQVFIDPGDVILVESPTFVHCVEIFEMFEAKCIAIECDDKGIILADLEEKIKKYSPKIVYVIPTFQNPTGKTLPEDRREAIAKMGGKYDVIILEDDPYCDLRYSGEALLPIKHFDKSGHTVFANSFSKIFSPGSRLGYACANAQIIKKMIDAKTATNSHTSMIPQVLCSEFFKLGYFKDHLKKICEIHKERRDVMIECIDKYFPEGTKRVFPDGGLFTWVELPGDIDTTELLKEASAKKVAYVAGEGFFTEGGGKGKNCMRISFGSQSPQNIRIGIERLGDLIKSKL